MASGCLLHNLPRSVHVSWKLCILYKVAIVDSLLHRLLGHKMVIFIQEQIGGKKQMNTEQTVGRPPKSSRNYVNKNERIPILKLYKVSL